MNILDYFIKRYDDDDIRVNLIWKDIDGEELNGIVKDCILKKAEPIDYPLTDGVILHLLDTSGKLIVVETGSDWLYLENVDDNDFYLRTTTPYSFRFINNKGKWCVLF